MKLTEDRKKFIVSRVEIILGVAVFAVFCMLTVGCPIKFVTGISCPGCGMTRAVRSLLAGDLAGAFYWHPLWLLLVPLTAYFLFDEYIPKKLSRALLVFFVVSFVGVYIYRLVFADNLAVTVDIHSGAVVECLKYILGG